MQRHLNFPFQNDERMGDTSLSRPVNHIGMHMHKPISITDSRQYMEKKNPSSMLYCYLMKASGSLNLISVTPEQFKKF